MRQLRVLVGGERYGVVRDAFLRRGHWAVSVDLVDTLSPGPHHKGPWEEIQGDGWDLAIFHRTCTNMTNAANKHLFRGMKKENGINEQRMLACLQDAWEFWDHMETCPIPHVAWENPVMNGYAKTMLGRQQDQTVQPWWFGNDESGPDNVKKATCWWLKELPKLTRTGSLDGSTAREEVFRMAPTADPEERRMARSKFLPGMSDALAEQWGDYVTQQRILAA